MSQERTFHSSQGWQAEQASTITGATSVLGSGRRRVDASAARTMTSQATAIARFAIPSVRHSR